MDPNIGGSNGSIVVSYEEELNGRYPGNIDVLNSSIRVTPEKTFPIFDIKVKLNDFLDQEPISTKTGKSGVVQRYDDKNEHLVVDTNDTFEPGDVIIGQFSESQATILREDSPESQYEIGASTLINKGFQKTLDF